MTYATETIILKWHPISERPALHRDVIVKHTGANPVIHPCIYVAANNLADLECYDEFHEFVGVGPRTRVRPLRPTRYHETRNTRRYLRRPKGTYYPFRTRIPARTLHPLVVSDAHNALRMTRKQAELVRIQLANYYSVLFYRMHKSSDIPGFEIVELAQSGNVGVGILLYPIFCYIVRGNISPPPCPWATDTLKSLPTGFVQVSAI